MPPTPPIEYLRVRIKDTGDHYSIVKSAYEADPDPYELLPDHPATSGDGTPLPPKHHEPLSSKKAGRQAAPATPEED